ncbi:hypothetical protein CROQUDRAFT_655963 [Cronartium quercuum f. sp. fusiforme G11]|uniref:Non-structural maintenance of chromosomes element 1 homolog n=1 Tax=Cronartium quercuum f. sp. fusiforme G11 TaxID=708437 RepID=A0A9P6TCQ9_9BASI|nr:hypothetical protein CROQUDRAFT_655963 [Cronartium quercuum f. sp. fusiforme G11]
MLLRRAAPTKTWLKIWRRCAGLIDGNVVADDEFPTFVAALNKRLEPMGFSIAQTVDGGIGPVKGDHDSDRRGEAFMGTGDHTAGGGIYPRSQGERWMGLVNTRFDPASQLATELNPQDISFFRRVVKRIILAPNSRYCISAHDAIRLQQKVPNMKKSDAENLLHVLVKKGWLSLSKGIYTLSIRAQLELGPYLEDTFEPEDLPQTCFACKEMVMRGYQCANAPCEAVVHVTCQRHYSRSRDICPDCRGPWSNEVFIGQDAPDEPVVSESEEEEEEVGQQQENSGSELNEEDSQLNTQTQTQKRKKRRSIPSQKKSQKTSTSKRIQDDDDDNEEDDHEGLGEGPSNSRRQSTASRRSTRFA